MDHEFKQNVKLLVVCFAQGWMNKMVSETHDWLRRYYYQSSIRTW